MASAKPLTSSSSLNAANSPKRRKKRNLTAKSHAPPSDDVDRKSNAAGSNKRYKSSALINDAAREFVCPITTELPTSPVVAADGHVYEREAISTLVSMQSPTGRVRSPVTNLPMGPRLVKSIPVRNAIEALVMSDAVDKDVADRWTIRMKDRRDVESLRSRAISGDADAMYDLGKSYGTGAKGVTPNQHAAFAWLKLSSNFGKTEALALVGIRMFLANGTPRDAVGGLITLGRAAQAGSDVAALFLSKMYEKGVCGVRKDEAQARFWLKEVCEGRCKVKHATKDLLCEAVERLDLLQNDDR